jgi:hypothetical protein
VDWRLGPLETWPDWSCVSHALDTKPSHCGGYALWSHSAGSTRHAACTALSPVRCAGPCRRRSELECWVSALHIERMVENSRLLEVIVVERNGSWEWQVQSEGTVLISGAGNTRPLARFLGNDARLRLLGEGGNA